MDTNFRRADRFAAWVALSIIFFVPLSKPGVNIALVALLLLLPFLSRVKTRLIAACRSPLAIGGAALFAVYAISALHAPEGAASKLWAMRPLLFLPVFLTVLPTDAWRMRGWYAFVLGGAVLLLLSITAGFGWIPRATASAVGQFGFSKNYGMQGVIYVAAAAISICLAVIAQSRRSRIVLCLFAAAFALGTPLLLEGRTAWVLLLVVAACLAVLYLGLVRGVSISVFVVAVFAALSWFSPLDSSRWQATQSDVAAAVSGELNTSWGVRAELIRIAPNVIEKAPFFGHGIGSWNAQMKAAAPTRMNPYIDQLTNPHQELLFIAAEQGLVGVVVFLALAFLLFRQALRMEGVAKFLFVAVLTTYFVYGLFNSVMGDFTHRHALLLLLTLIPLDLTRYRVGANAQALNA